MKKSIQALLILFVLLSMDGWSQTILSLQPASEGKDAIVKLNSANSNYADHESNTVYTWTNSGSLGKMRSFIEFDLSSVPLDAVISHVALSLYYNPSDDFESFDTHYGTNEAYIERIVSAWEESTLTWNNQPGVTTLNRIYLPQSESGTQDYLAIDVTNLFLDMLASSEGNNGIRIRMLNEQNPYRSLLFASSDHPNESLHPKLDITYVIEDNNCITLKPNSDGKDAIVTLNSANSNYADHESNTVYTWTNSGSIGKMRSFIEFDLYEIPEGAIINYSGLSLYYNPSDNFESFDTHYGTNEAYIERITSAWEESTLTWNNQPAVTSQNRIYLPQSESGTQDYLAIDVTNLFLDMLASSEGNNGIRIRMLNEQNPYRSLLFASSDHPDESLHPELRVCYLLSNNVEEKNEETWDLAVFPNPSNGIFTIRTDQNHQNLDLEIYTLSGALMKREKVYTEFYQIDLSNQSPGIYIMKISTSEGQSETKKLVISP